MQSLLKPIVLGDIECANRIVMAPMTRSRADDDRPNELMVEYYRQRASAGLIVTEGIQPSIHGKGYPRTPGLHNQAQADAWRKVVTAVHTEGGRIVAQLMHVGRVASHFNKPAGARTVAPSVVRANVELFTDQAGLQGCDEPQALSLAEIPGLIHEYVAAAQLAREAGFDGVELHCTSGYLPMQFLASNTNLRTDAYGGDANRRSRFVVETMEAMAAVIGPGRVGLRICPGNPYNDVVDSDPVGTYSSLLAALRPLRYAYLHVIAARTTQLDGFELARSHFDGPLIINDGFAPDTAAQAVTSKVGDAVSFGRQFIGNPDLVYRIRNALPLARFNPKTLYTPGPIGYTDYPNYREA